MDIYDGQNLDIEANAVITGAEMQSPADFLASYNNSADENVPIGYSQDNLNVIKQQSPLRRLGMTRDTMRFVIDNPDLIKYIGTSEFAPMLMKKIQLATKMQQNRHEAERRRQEWEDSPTVFDDVQVYIPGENKEARDARMQAAINARMTPEQRGDLSNVEPESPFEQMGAIMPGAFPGTEVGTVYSQSRKAVPKRDYAAQDNLEQEWNRAYMKQARAQGYSFSDKDKEDLRLAKELISSPTGKNSWRGDVNLRNALKKYGDNPLKQAEIVEYAYDLYSRESRLIATLNEHHPYWRDLSREERCRLAGRIADRMGMSTEGMYLDRLDERGIADIQLKQLTNLFHIPEFITRAWNDRYFREHNADFITAFSREQKDFDYKGVTKYDGMDAVLKKGGAYMAQLDRLRGENAWSTVGDSLLESLRYSAELAILNSMLPGGGEFGGILTAGGFDGTWGAWAKALGTGKGWGAVGKYLGVNSVTQAANAFNPLSLFNSYAQAAIESENLPDLMYQDENGETVVMEPKVRDTLMDKFAQNLLKNYVSYFSENMGELLPKIKVLSWLPDDKKSKILQTFMEGAQSPYTWLQKALNAAHFSGFANELAEEYLEKIAGRAVTMFGESSGIRAFDLGEDSFFGDWGEFGTTAAVVALQSLVMGGAGHVGSRIGNRGVGSDVRAVLDASRDIVQAAEDCGISTSETARLIKDTLDRNLKDTKFSLKADDDLLSLVRQNPEFFGKLGITEEAVSQKLQNGELVDVNLAALTALQTQSEEYKQAGEALKNLTLDPQELTRQQQEQREQKIKLEIAYADQRRKALKQSLSDTVGRRLEEIAAEHPEASLDTDTTGGLFNSIIDVITDTFGGEAAEQVALAMVDRYAQNPSEFESDWNAGKLPTEAEKEAHWKPALAALRKGDLKAMQALANAFGVTVDLGTPEKWNEMNQQRRTQLVDTASDARTQAQNLRSQAEQARQEGDEAKAQELEKQAAAQEKTASDADAYVKRMDGGEGKVQGYTVKNGKDTRIYINPDTDADVPLFLAFGDELVHYLNAASPETYALIRDAIFPKDGARTPRMQRYLDKIRALYADLKNEEDFQEEAVSHILGRMLSDFDAQLELANAIEERRMGAGRTFLEAVLDTLSKILRWLGNWGGSEGRALFEDYDGVRRKVVSALADYAVLRQELDAAESSPDSEAEAQAETGTPIDTQGISQAEIDEMHNRIVEWGGDTAAIDWAKGKTLNECIERFGNELEAIAYIPRQYLQYFDGSTSNNRVYSGKAYFIDHIANHKHGDIGAQQFIEMQSMFLEPDEVIKDTRNKPNGAPKDALIFVKRFAKNRMVIIELSEEEGNIVLHKSLYNTKDRVYPGLPRVPGGGRSPISHAGNATSGGSLSARDTGDTIQQNAEGANAEIENNEQPATLPPVTFGLTEMPEGERPQVNESDPDWYRAAKERGLTFRAWHPKGEEAPSGGVMAIIDLASGDVLFSGDEGYRNEFQPRYESATRDAQIKRMAQDPHALQFFSVDATDKGTPMFAYRDGRLYAISGNGRGKSLREMYRTYHTDGEYRALLKQWAAQNGYKLDEGMGEPVLARILPDTMTDRELKLFADFANANATLQATRSESLLKTASEIVNDAEMLSLLHPAKDGSLLTSENMEFFLKFMERYGTVEGDLDERGLPTEAVETRVEKALLASLFLDEADKRQALRTVNELMSRRAADLGISTRVNAVAANMPGVMDMRRRNPAYDISPELGLAMRALLDYAAHRKDFGYPGMFTMQPGIDGGMMPAAVQALFLPLAEAKSFDDVNAIFSGWADSVDAETGGMAALMGEPRTKEQILEGKRQAFIDAHPEQFRFSVSENIDIPSELQAAALQHGIDLSRETPEFRDVFTTYYKTKAFLKAPNGQPTNLTARQWCQVRTPQFKNWFGDWENALKRAQLTGKIIAQLKHDSIKVRVGERGPIDAAQRWIRENPQTPANTIIGTVAITENGMQASFSHTKYQNKLDTIPAIKSILENGCYLGYLYDFSGATLRNHYFAGKVSIDNDEHIVFIRVHDPDGNENTYYVHEVFTEDEIKNQRQCRPAPPKKGQRSGNASDFYKNILRQVLNANPDDVSKVVDDNGEPLVVYHGSKWNPLAAPEGKGVFSHAKVRNTSEGVGFYFTEDKSLATGYGDTGEYFLNLRNPVYAYSKLDLLSEDEMYDIEERDDLEGGDIEDALRDARDAKVREKVRNVIDNLRSKGYEFYDEIEQDFISTFDGNSTVENVLDTAKEAIGFVVDEDVDEEKFVSDYRQAETVEFGIDGYVSKNYADGRGAYVAFSPNQIKSATDNTGSFSNEDNDIRFSLSDLWTGTSADYEQPSLHYIGTGEGAQVYGWGLYATDNRAIAHWYAEKDASYKYEDDILTYKGKQLKFQSSTWNGYSPIEQTAIQRIFVNGGVRKAINNIQKYIDELKDKVHYYEKPGLERVKDSYLKQIKNEQDILDYLKSNIKEFKFRKGDVKGHRNLYRQTWFTNREGEGEANLLDWRGRVTDEQKRQIQKALNAEPYFPDEWKRFFNRYNFETNTGEELYNHLSFMVGSPRGASEFLFRAGIDGVKYEAAQSDGSAGWNYVSFSDTNMRVDEHIRYSIQERDATLQGITADSLSARIKVMLDDGEKSGLYRFTKEGDRDRIIAKARDFFDRYSHKTIPLSDGRCVYFCPDKRAFDRLDSDNLTAWCEYAIHAVTSSGKRIEGKDFSERLYNDIKAENLDKIEDVIQEENVFAKLEDNNPERDAVIFVGQTSEGKRMEIITRLDSYGNANADLSEVTVLTTRSNKKTPPLAPLTEVVVAVAQHQGAGFSPTTANTLPQNQDFSSANSENLRNSMYEGDIGTIRRVGHGMFNFPENTLGDDYRAVLNALGNRDETAGIFRRSAAHVLNLARGFVSKYPDLNANLAAQLKAVENWAGWQEDPQEAFAEAFENYMLFDTVPQAEGESELAWGFHGLKGVLLSVYRNNPQQVVDGEVRALLDASILAGEIVENTLCFDELLEGLHEYARAGLAGSGSNWDIVHIAEKARAATIEAQSKYIARRVKELRKEWKAIATQAAGQLPCYKFGRRIKEEGGLDRDMMLKLVGQRAVTRLRELGLMAKRGTEGVNPLVRLLEPDARAIAGSAQELAEELIKWGKEKDFIDDYVERETRKWMEAQAWNLDDEALANSELIKGLDTLAQSITQENAGMEARQAFKTEAQERLSRMTVKELLSYDNSLRSARSILADITRELGHKSPDGVALLQHIGNMRMQLEMCRQLAAFRKDIEGTVKLISRAARMKRGTIYDKYHDALIELARYFGISGKAVDEGRNYRRDLYQAYVKECEEGGVAPAYFPDIVFTTDMADYRNLSFADMAALHDFAQWLYGEGRDRVKELASSRARRIQDTVEQSLAAFAGQRHSHSRPPTEDMTPKEKALHWLQNLRASFTLLWRTMGESCPAMKERHRQLALAATRELILQQEAMKPLTESINKLYDIVKDLPIEKDPRLPAFAKEGDRFYDSRNYREWTKERVIMAVLYMGTESGRQRLRAGFGWTGTEEDVDARLNAIPAVLPAAALKEINKIWQTVGAGALTRETKAMFLAENHYELKTLPPVPMDVTSADGERVHLTGGYIPLRYLYSNRKQTVQMGYTPLPLLSSPSGTFARCAVLPEAAPLRLGMNTLIADVVERAHYATHTSLLREIFAAVSDRRFAEEFGRTQGWERYEAMLQMLRHIGNPAREGWDSLGALEKWGRTMMVSSALMANLSSAGMQLTSLTVGAGELGKYWVKSVLGFLAHPIESVEAGRRVSAMLRNRADMQDIDLHSAAGRFSENKLASLQKHFSALAYSMMRFIDVRVAAIDFNAAYAKALDEGMSQEDALAYAEDFLARAQGSTRAMDAMPFQLNTWGRLMTPFITAVAAQANVTAHDLLDKDSGAWRKVQNLAFNMLIPTILAGVVRYALKGGFGGDEDKRDEALMAAIREMLGQPFAGIPIARDVADLLIGMATGQGAQGGMDVSLLGAYNNLLRDAFNAVKAGTQGDWDYAGYLACDAVSKAFNMPVFVIYERYRKILEAYGVDAYNPRKELKDK